MKTNLCIIWLNRKCISNMRHSKDFTLETKKSVHKYKKFYSLYLFYDKAKP